MLDAVNDKSLEEAVKALAGVIEVFGQNPEAQEEVRKLLADHEQFLTENNLNLSRGERKKLTQNLRRQALVAEDFGRFNAEQEAFAINAIQGCGLSQANSQSRNLVDEVPIE